MSRRDARRLRRAGRVRGGGLLWFLIVIGILTSVNGGRWTRRDSLSDSNDVIERSAVLGQSRTVSHASQLRRGHLLAVMGQCDVDLTQAVVAPGEEAVVTVVAVMGSVRLRVPNDWIVDMRAMPALGGVHDTRDSTRNPGGGDTSAGAPGQPTRLVIRGVVMMGDVRISN